MGYKYVDPNGAAPILFATVGCKYVAPTELGAFFCRLGYKYAAPTGTDRNIDKHSPATNTAPSEQNLYSYRIHDRAQLRRSDIG